jgi:holo-[acyl-carrier protein] synthase
MILGCGIDLVEVARFEREFARRGGDSFDDLFTRAERAGCQTQRRPLLGYAARFAAKEACFKALGTGKAGQMSWHDLDIGVAGGRPSVTLSGETARVARQMGVDAVHLAWGWTCREAVAWVVLSGTAPARTWRDPDGG